MKRLIPFALLALVILALTGCTSTASTHQGHPMAPQPLWTASDRDTIIVLSDLHLGIDDAYAEIAENHPYLVEFLRRVAVTADVREVVLGGDVLDEWFLPLSYDETDRRAFYRQVLVNNSDVVAACNEIIASGIKLVYVVGNHDMSVIGQLIEDAMPGIVIASGPPGLGLYRTGARNEIVIEHGHRYDAFSAPDTITNATLVDGPTMLPPGYFYARFAADWVLKGKPAYVSALPMISRAPNPLEDPDQGGAYAYYRTLDAVFKPIVADDSFTTKLLNMHIDGYHGSYSVADLFPVLTEDGEITAPLLYRHYQRTWQQRQIDNGVTNPSSFIASALGAIDSRYFEQQARIQYQVDEQSSDTAVVVFGHTHTPDLHDYGYGHYYVNSGTWIADNTNYKEKDGSLLSRTFVVVTTAPVSEVEVYQYRPDGSLRLINELLQADHQQ